MKKLLLFAALVVGLVVLAKRLGPKVRDLDWEERFERLPDNAPPKWMFRNISAIRENTDRILELLDEDRTRAAGSPSPTDSPAPTP